MIESLQQKATFGIEELGLLDPVPLKSLDTIVALCLEAMHAPVVALFVFDDRSGSLLVRSVAGAGSLGPTSPNLPIALTASSLTREVSNYLSISNLASRKNTRDAAERQKFGATGYLGVPIKGPGGDVVAVLAAMTLAEHKWSRREKTLIKNFAHLVHEQILLRAALHTVKLMAMERHPVGGFDGVAH